MSNWEWFEKNRMQCWPEFRWEHRGQKELKAWVVSGRVNEQFIQVTRPSLIEAIEEARKAGPDYDDVFPVSLHRGNGDVWHLLDRHNDEIAVFSEGVELETMQRIVRLLQ